MNLSYDAVKDFLDYIECYPESDEVGYDGVHDGGWKGVREDAPEEAKKAYEEFLIKEEKAKKRRLEM